MHAAQVMNLGRLLTHTARLFPERPALIQEGGRTWTWGVPEESLFLTWIPSPGSGYGEWRDGLYCLSSRTLERESGKFSPWLSRRRTHSWSLMISWLAGLLNGSSCP